jgi:hypothetical protein
VSDLSDFADVARDDNGLCVLSTVRQNGDVQSTVVNAGVIAHPVTGHRVVALIADRNSRKVAHLRAAPKATVVARASWNWTTVEAQAELVDSPDESRKADTDAFRRLLCEVSAAAIGGTAGEWREHVNSLVLDEHVVVLLSPVRIYSGAP